MSRMSTLAVRIVPLLLLLLGHVSAQCRAGQYSLNGHCTACAAGYYCPNGYLQPCNAGSYSQSGATQCTDCGAGWYSSASLSTSCTICPAGYKCVGNNPTIPQECDPGTYSAEGAALCTDCGKGKFNSFHASTKCCDCCAGTFNSQDLQDHCQACQNGQWSSPGSGSCSNTYFPGAPATCVQTTKDVCPPITVGAPTTRRKRNDIFSCPKFGHKACPVLNGRPGQRECVDVRHDLWSCGGCMDVPASEGGGVDCTAIPGVNSVSCERGRCLVQDCATGYNISEDASTCLSLGNPTLNFQSSGVLFDS